VTGSHPDIRAIAAEELDRFRSIVRLRNHWARTQHPRTYYWYLTFEDCASLRHLIDQCHSILSLPYYDPTPLNALHTTIDRVILAEDAFPDRLQQIEVAAHDACRHVQPFGVSVGALGGTASAIGFRVVPDAPIRHLRNVVRAATLSINPNAPVKDDSTFRPHVAIAYCHSDGSANQALAAIEQLSRLPPIELTVSEVALVLLDRTERSYSWRAVARIPLGAAPTT
jgi:hypothetical protein